MKVFSLERGVFKPGGWSLAIDPGLKTTGLALLHPVGDSYQLHLHNVTNAESPTSHAYPELYDLCQRQVSRYRAVLLPYEQAGFSWSQCQIITEYMHLQGIFSLGLAMILTYFTTLFYFLGVLRVVFLPNRIPEWFLHQRSVKDSETVHFCKKNLPFCPQRRISAHECDALLFSLFFHWQFYSRFHDLHSLRAPQYELVNILWQPIMTVIP